VTHQLQQLARPVPSQVEQCLYPFQILWLASFPIQPSFVRASSIFVPPFLSQLIVFLQLRAFEGVLRVVFSSTNLCKTYQKMCLHLHQQPLDSSCFSYS
jgi:hypothetical protein